MNVYTRYQVSVYMNTGPLGPVVQSIVSLTTALRRQLLKYVYPNYIIRYAVIFVEKKCENLLHSLQKILTFFSTKITSYL